MASGQRLAAIARNTAAWVCRGSLCALFIVSVGACEAAQEESPSHVSIESAPPPLSAEQAQLAESAAAMAQRSHAVVEGTVVDVLTHESGPNGESGLHTEVVLQVDATLKGPPSAWHRLWVMGGETATERRVVRGQHTFAGGDHVVVFGRLRPGSNVLWADGSMSKWIVEAGEAKLRPTLDDHETPRATASLPLVALQQAAGGAR